MRAPLEPHYGWSKTESLAPDRWSILFLTLGMILAGFWQDRRGPRLVASVEGVLLATGCLLAGWMGSSPMGLNLAYGVLAGAGVGFAYVTPISTCLPWFPDKRGFVVGLVVMGLGAGSLIFAPLLEALLEYDPARLGVTIPRTFFLLAALFQVVVPGCAQFFLLPPPDSAPAGWKPQEGQASIQPDRTPMEMLRSWQFYVMWLVYSLGSAVGLTAVGESAPLVRELAGAAAVLTGGTVLGVMSLFSGGRLLWGTLSCRLGRRRVLFVICGIAAAACALVLAGASNLWRVLAGLGLVGLCFGGYLTVMPALTAECFGPRRLGANYGLMFTAWGVAGFTAPRWIAALREKSRAPGNLAAGYSEMFYLLAALAATDLLLTLTLRRPPAPKQ